VLMEHTWPGNVRELANVIEHAMILCDVLPIGPEHLPQRFLSRQTAAIPFRPAGAPSLRDLEMQAIHEALGRNNGNKPKAAEDLGISVKTLYNKLNQLAGLSKTA
jgi:DNA-binding NtrC family response regulator